MAVRKIPSNLPPRIWAEVVGVCIMRGRVPVRFSSKSVRPPFETVNIRNISAIPGAKYISKSNLTAAPLAVVFSSWIGWA